MAPSPGRDYTFWLGPLGLKAAAQAVLDELCQVLPAHKEKVASRGCPLLRPPHSRRLAPLLPAAHFDQRADTWQGSGAENGAFCSPHLSGLYRDQTLTLGFRSPQDLIGWTTKELNKQNSGNREYFQATASLLLAGKPGAVFRALTHYSPHPKRLQWLVSNIYF